MLFLCKPQLFPKQLDLPWRGLTFLLREGGGKNPIPLCKKTEGKKKINLFLAQNAWREGGADPPLRSESRQVQPGWGGTLAEGKKDPGFMTANSSLEKGDKTARQTNF